jgi:hypothetical protein
MAVPGTHVGTTSGERHSSASTEHRRTADTAKVADDDGQAAWVMSQAMADVQIQQRAAETVPPPNGHAHGASAPDSIVPTADDGFVRSDPIGRSVPRPPRSITVAGTSYPVVLPNPRDPRLHVALVTITVHIIGQVGLNFQLSVPQILAAIFACAVVEMSITFGTKRSIVWPASAMLTGSGVALILRLPTTPVGDHWTFHKWWVYAAVAVASLLTKYLIRYRGAPIFNPSNVGLVAVFLIFGSSRVEPLDFWWAPLNGWMLLAYAVIVIGGVAITARLRFLAGALAFWVTLAIGTALVAATGHCMTARWAFAPVCGFDYWVAIVASPEVLVFMFFMITDPRTVPRGRVGHVTFSILAATVSVLVMAPQTNEFWAKVGLLGGLTVMCALRPLLERALPESGSVNDRVGRFAARLTSGDWAGVGARRRLAQLGVLGAAVVLVPTSVVFAGTPARRAPVPEFDDVVGRVPHEVDPSTMPTIDVDQEVLDWNHELDGEGVQQIVLTLVENLEIENQALLRSDPTLLEAVDHGDRLEEMRAILDEGASSGTIVIDHYQIETVDVVLLIPFGRQDGLSLGLKSRGTVTTVSDASAGGERTSVAPFETTFVMRRATGGRWLNVAALSDDG